MLFKDEMADLIEQDLKTATRRFSDKKFYRIGSLQPVQRNYYTKAHTYIKIREAYPQRLGDMTDEDAIAEGKGFFHNTAEYFLYLININKVSLKKLGIVPLDGSNKLHLTDAFLNLQPTVYEFDRIKSDRIIIADDDWPIGMLVTKDKQTYFKIIEKRLYGRRMFKYWLALEKNEGKQE